MSYIITYYLPSGLFVVVSWISFLIPPDIVPGKYNQTLQQRFRTSGNPRISKKLEVRTSSDLPFITFGTFRIMTQKPKLDGYRIFGGFAQPEPSKGHNLFTLSSKNRTKYLPNFVLASIELAQLKFALVFFWSARVYCQGLCGLLGSAGICLGLPGVCQGLPGSAQVYTGLTRSVRVTDKRKDAWWDIFMI